MISRPLPQRSSEYASTRMYAVEYRPKGLTSAISDATNSALTVPKTIATVASGWVRRHNNDHTNTKASAIAIGRHNTSGRRAPSRTAASTTTPTRSQSRHTRLGAFSARGSSHSARRVSGITTSQ